MSMSSADAGGPSAPLGREGPVPGRRRRLGALRRWLASAARRSPALARRHWLLTALLAAGLALRILAQIAYRPSLLFIDSTKYLLGAYPGNDPPGYGFALKPVLLVGNLDLVPAVQHLLGLAMAVTIYALLLRRGAPRWLSALATVPVLFDGYQLQIEQTVMPDVMFEVLIVAGLALLLWRPRPAPWMIVAGGLALGASATARQVGEILILPAAVYICLTFAGWRSRVRQTALLAGAFALPILFASFTNYVSIHRFSLAPYASGTIYGRMAGAADCQTLKLPSYERPLCPTAQQKKLGPDGLDHQAGSPIKAFQPPLGMSTPAVVRDFWHRVLLQQPLNVAGGIYRDTVKLFALTRDGHPGDTPISRWQFQPDYPLYPPYTAVESGILVFGTYTPDGVERTLGTGQQFGGANPVVVKPLATFLRGYQLRGGYTPGPLFTLTALAGLAGSVAALRRRVTPGQYAARACLLLLTAGAAVLLASDVFEFSWRYQLPALVTLPPAAALALTAALRRSRARPGEAAPPAQAGEAGRPGEHTRDRAAAG